MSFQAKQGALWALLAQVACRYREANRLQKTVILDEFVAAKGSARKYCSAARAPKIQRPRERQYGSTVQQV